MARLLRFLPCLLFGHQVPLDPQEHHCHCGHELHLRFGSWS